MAMISILLACRPTMFLMPIFCNNNNFSSSNCNSSSSKLNSSNLFIAASTMALTCWAEMSQPRA